MIENLRTYKRYVCNGLALAGSAMRVAAVSLSPLASVPSPVGLCLVRNWGLAGGVSWNIAD